MITSWSVSKKALPGRLPRLKYPSTMELQSAPFPLLITTLFIILLTLIVFIRKIRKPKSQTLALPLPPRPSSLPIIGSLHRLVSPSPHRTLRDLATNHGPLMLMRLGRVDHLIVSSREAAQEIMKTNDINFASRPLFSVNETLLYGCADIAFSPYGPDWRSLRKILVTHLLSLHRVKSFQSVREEEVARLVNDIYLAGEGPVNLRAMFKALTSNIITRVTFGTKSRNHQRFLELMAEGFLLASGFSVADFFPSLKFVDVLRGIRRRAESIHRQLDEILGEVIREHEMKAAANKGHKTMEAEDIIDLMLRLKDQGETEVPITDNMIKAVVMDLFTGGTDTSSTTLEWAMTELIKNTKMLEKAQEEVRRVAKGKAKVSESDVQELEFISLVIKETLRLHPPIPLLLPRVSKDSCPVQGYMVPAGCRVMVNAWALGRDPKYWDDAESFRPERFEGNTVDFKGAHFEFIPFGAGRRICPGITFGLASMELALAQLLFCYDWKLPHGMKPKELDMSENSELNLLRKSPLVLLATPCVPPPLG